MPCGKFTLKDTVQDEGVRAKIISKAPKGVHPNPWNLEDKKTVEVYVRAETKEEIAKFRESIKDMADKGELGKGNVEISDVEFNDYCDINELMYSDRLIIEQMDKFIDHGKLLVDNTGNLIKKTDEDFNNLGKKIEKGFDELPDRIAKALT